MSARILVVEDETHLAAGLRFSLEREGYTIELVENGEDALALFAREEHFDAVVLDIMLPGIDGFEVAKELRAKGTFVPILMLTARGRPEDVLGGFAAGADDYLQKPFDLAILLARVKAVIRRKQWVQVEAATPVAVPASEDTYSFGSKTIDFARLELRSRESDERTTLTVMEAELLRALIASEGRPVSRKVLLEDVWGLKEDTDTRAIDNFIVRLRRYLEEDPSKPKHLLTVRGMGYQFVANPMEKR